LLGGGIPERLVDLVVHPTGEDEVRTLVRLADRHGVVLIPYGGGTNVSGALTCPPHERRTIVSVDMRGMNRILEIDRANGWVVVEAGITGKDLEARLEAEGLTAGQVPDSVELSTVGGWIATNASGMKKNRYGNIEDAVLDAVLVTPRGEVRARPRGAALLDRHPGAAAGVRQRGRARHRHPRRAAGVAAARGPALRLLRVPRLRGRRPLPARRAGRRHPARQHPPHQQHRVPARPGARSRPTRHERARREADEAVRHAREGLRPRADGGVHRRDGGFGGRGAPAGARPVRPPRRARRPLGRPRERPPRLRRHLRDRLHPRLPQQAGHPGRDLRDLGPWSRIHDITGAVEAELRRLCAERGVPGTPYLSYRISQSYRTGVCIYFTMGFCGRGLADAERTFHEIEHRMREVVLEQGGSLSHHHGVGKIRQGFVPQVHSEASIAPPGR
jgi:FAD/FMN-containing dehydrogenase